MRITILGAGKQGTSIAQALLPGGHEITIIDKDADLIDRLQSRMDIMCINADAEDIDCLKSAKVQRSDVLIACTHSDDKNIVLCSIAKELGVKRTFARVRGVEQFDHIDLIKRSMKIDLILNPDFACANEIYKSLTKHFSFSEGYQMINGIAALEFDAEKVPELLNRSLKDSSSYLGGLLIAAVSREGRVIIPNGDTVFEKGDDLYAIGTRTDVTKMRDKVREANAGMHLSDVMIAGGGKTAFFLAKQLIADGSRVKIIESSKKRAEYMALALEKADVVYGDATDSDLLFEEQIEKFGAFVACTGFDEENIMLAMYAKQQGVENVIAKMTRNSFGSMIENMGNIMIINPVEMCTANVLRSLKEDNSIVFSKLIHGQAEFMEIQIDDSALCGKQLKDIHIPEGILIAAIYRNGEMIIPRGLTTIEKSDRLVVLSLLSKIGELHQLIKTGNSGDF